MFIAVDKFKDTSFLHNPSIGRIKETFNLQWVFALLANKSEALLLQSNAINDRRFIKAAVETSKLTDQVIDEIRNRQVSSNSKLYWRDRTRNFYRVAIEIAYQAEDPESIFYFMEKSRAVLLNDKLNELGSLAQLPPAEAAKEQQIRINLASLERQKSSDPQSPSSIKLLDAKDDFEDYIKSLEKKFPAYYQYKYNSRIPSVRDIRKKLLKAGESYLSYFETDSVLYAFVADKTTTRYKKISFPGYADTLKVFLSLCKNRDLLNTSYGSYAKLAHLLHAKIFEPLKIPPGRVFVSPDLNFIPLEAFCSDQQGKKFLLYDYIFNYTYSAGYLLKILETHRKNDGSFLGIAPESFAPRLALASLEGSARSLQNIATNFRSAKLLEHRLATRNYFLNEAGNYNLLHVYAHASIDTSGEEPLLYMNDSAIAISELQNWRRPKVNLAFLAACETGAGETYIGEGVNSLARSFAAIGVPATIATLWQADNHAMYSISEKFYEFLNTGMKKDEALQKAKIAFIKEGGMESELPFYWASAVLLGNNEAVDSFSGRKYIVWTAVILILASLVFYLTRSKKRGRLRQR